MKKDAIAFTIVLAAASACGRGTMPNALPPSMRGDTGALSITHTPGSPFWEYTLPVVNYAALQPRQLASGPNNTVWFPSCYGPPKLYRLSAITGAVAAFTPPAIPSSIVTWGGTSFLINESSTCAIVSAGGYFWYTLVGTYAKCRIFPCGSWQRREWLVRATPSSAALTLFPVVGQYQACSTANIAVDAYGKLWFSTGRFFSNMSMSGIEGASVSLPNNFTPLWVTSAPDKNVNVTASAYHSTTNQLLSAVFKVSPLTGVVLAQYDLPSYTGNLPGYCAPGTSMNGAVCAITSDTNGNLWVTEPAFNKIAKITTAGAVTQYDVRTSNAWDSAITNADGTPLTAAFSGALWFTEAEANKIGRIASSGSVLEYSIPTANSLPSGIAPCLAATCGAAGGVWFAENATGKIGRFDYP